MALRLLVHMSRVGVSLSDAGAKRLPVVLYNDESAWMGARRFAELLDADGRLLALTRASTRTPSWSSTTSWTDGGGRLTPRIRPRGAPEGGTLRLAWPRASE